SHERADRGSAHARPGPEGRGLRALLPALLALRNPVDLLRQELLVHRHGEAARRAAAGERDGQLVSTPRQARTLWPLALQQRRLGALTRALLGNAAARMALSTRSHAHRRLLRGARATLRAPSRRPPPSVRGRARVSVSAHRRRRRAV